MPRLRDTVGEWGDAFRPHLAQIEAFIVKQAGIVFDGQSQVQVQHLDSLLDGMGLDLQARLPTAIDLIRVGPAQVDCNLLG